MPQGLNAVVDISHHNANVDFSKLKAAGILGVIHKASQGSVGADPTYAQHRAGALEAGLLWGAYHFGTDSDGVEQAVNFLNVVGDVAGTLIALDFETNPTGPSMSLEEARAFVTHVNEVTGRYPGLYSGHDIKAALGSGTDSVLGNCWFWLAQYGPTAVVPQNWNTWKLWQYTDGAIGPDPTEIPGVGRFDRDLFNGTADELRAFWGT
jgi:lysozyme